MPVSPTRLAGLQFDGTVRGSDQRLPSSTLPQPTFRLLYQDQENPMHDPFTALPPAGRRIFSKTPSRCVSRFYLACAIN